MYNDLKKQKNLLLASGCWLLPVRRLPAFGMEGGAAYLSLLAEKNRLS